MTLGQRIQKKRKEKGLSQEKLGEQLNVSRQTVYKWENDQTIPELFNLIAMAEILDVRAGWLINEEESESDLQMHQLLKQMEETGRARSLQEKQNKKKRKIRIAALALIMTGITITLLTKINQLENSYQQLQNTLHTQNTVMQNQISSITSSVQQTLDRYNAVTLNSDVVVEGYDYASNMVQLSFQARPRTYVSGMKTVFHIDCDGEVIDVEGVENDRTFTGNVQVSLLAQRITVTVEFETGEESEIMQLVEYNELIRNTFSCYDFLWPLTSCISNDEKKFDDLECMIHEYDMYVDEEMEIPEIVSMEVYLSEDGKKIAEYTCSKIHGEDDRNPIQNLIYSRPEDLKLNPDKEYAEHLVVTDEYGRQMEVIQYMDDVKTIFR